VGGAALRAGALSDQRVISLINERFVPVWINVRTDPLPPIKAVEQALLRTQLDRDRHVSDVFSEGFFLRSLVLSPDAQDLLNPQADTVGGSMESYARRGYFAYAQVHPNDYLIMLEGALRRFEGAPVTCTSRR
jgi:hypothetical protein